MWDLKPIYKSNNFKITNNKISDLILDDFNNLDRVGFKSRTKQADENILGTKIG